MNSEGLLLPKTGFVGLFMFLRSVTVPAFSHQFRPSQMQRQQLTLPPSSHPLLCVHIEPVLLCLLLLNQFSRPSAFALLLLHHTVATIVNPTTTSDYHHHRAQSQLLPCFNTNVDVAVDHHAQQPPPIISLWALIIDAGIALSGLKSNEDLMVVQRKRVEKRK